MNFRKLFILYLVYFAYAACKNKIGSEQNSWCEELTVDYRIIDANEFDE